MGKKNGRPAKGPRDIFMIRVTAAVGARIREEADSTGRTFTDVCAEKLAAAYGLPATNELDIQPPLLQEELRMTG